MPDHIVGAVYGAVKVFDFGATVARLLRLRAIALALRRARGHRPRLQAELSPLVVVRWPGRVEFAREHSEDLLAFVAIAEVMPFLFLEL